MLDPLLEHIIALAEDDTPVETHVTLMVGGMLVTGRVVGEAAYMAHHPLTRAYLALDEAEADEDEVEAVEAEEDEEDEEEDETDDVGYVHLRDARTHAPGQGAPGGAAGWCRIALTDVSGFMLAG